MFTPSIAVFLVAEDAVAVLPGFRVRPHYGHGLQLDDRPPDAKPDQLPFAVAAFKHLIGTSGCRSRQDACCLRALRREQGTDIVHQRPPTRL